MRSQQIVYYVLFIAIFFFIIFFAEADVGGAAEVMVVYVG